VVGGELCEIPGTVKNKREFPTHQSRDHLATKTDDSVSGVGVCAQILTYLVWCSQFGDLCDVRGPCLCEEGVVCARAPVDISNISGEAAAT
jgi:hypothetical protein